MHKLTNRISIFTIAIAIAVAPLVANAGADFKWWSTTSGQINLTNASGTQRQNLPSNPTGAQSVRSANTQAPTVIVQATASLPVKNIGDTCTPTTAGTAPNQTAGEGTAITADRVMILTCNAAISVWLPARVYANEGDACNIIYKTTSYAVGDRLTLSGALPSGTIASNSAGLTLSCQSGVWKKQAMNDCPYWVGDLNWLEGTAGQPGCINGNGLGNAPNGEWFFVEYNRHVNSGNYYVSQRAVGMTGTAAGQTWTRSQQSGSPGSGWSPWNKVMAGMVIRDSALYPFASCPSGTSFLGAMSATGMAVTTAEANYWRWINSAGQVWFCA